MATDCNICGGGRADPIPCCCPFCGNPEPEPMWADEAHSELLAVCGKCRAQAPVGDWNRRAPTVAERHLAAMTAERDALAAKMKSTAIDYPEAVAAAYRIVLSPCEWTWTQAEQERMAEALVNLAYRMDQVRSHANRAGAALAVIEQIAGVLSLPAPDPATLSGRPDAEAEAPGSAASGGPGAGEVGL